MRVETYQDARGHWRWRVRAANGRVMADGGEGYVKKAGLKKALLKMSTLGTFAYFNAAELL